MTPLRMVLDRFTLVFVFPMPKNRWERFSDKNDFQCSFDPGSGEGSHDPPRSGLRLIHTRISVPHARKPLGKIFKEKIIFDVPLTPEVERSHMTPLEVV